MFLYLDPVSVYSAAAYVVEPVVGPAGAPEASSVAVRFDGSRAGEHTDDQVALQYGA